MAGKGAEQQLPPCGEAVRAVQATQCGRCKRDLVRAVYWQWALPISASLLASMAHVPPQRRPSLESQLRRELGSILRLCSPSQVCLSCHHSCSHALAETPGCAALCSVYLLRGSTKHQHLTCVMPTEKASDHADGLQS